jgi:hypothetical protein
LKLVSQLPQASNEQPDPRGDLDTALLVSEWRTPRTKPITEELPPGAPSWWRGEEEASESFFKSMGIRLGPDGEVLHS